jgi:HEAT repeat protein
VVPAPVVTPVTPTPPVVVSVPSINGYLDRAQLDEIRRAADEARMAGEDARREAQRALRDMGPINVDIPHIEIPHIEIPHIEMPHVEMPHVEMPFVDVPRIEIPPINIPNFNFNFTSPRVFSTFEQGPQWTQSSDPADSLYQKAREAINRNDYSRAASLFAELLSKYPGYRQASAAVYYEALARYRVGTLENLRQALKVLETNTNRLAYDSRNNEAISLQAQILRALAARNEPGADGKLKELFAKYPAASCDRDANSVKASVLNSLYHSDPETTVPYIKAYLEMRDACSSELRRTAIYLLAERPSEANTQLLINVAKNDTVKDVRTQAIDLLSRMPGDAAINALQELMRDTSDRVSRAAVRSLMRNDNTRARAALRAALLDKPGAPESQRVEAIQSYDRDNTSPEDAAYLRGLYNRKDESDRVKSAIISTLSRVPSDENVAFLLGVANNKDEISSLRSQALRAISRTTLSTPDLVKLYDNVDNRQMRQSIVEALSNRKEDAALNKLLDIVKDSTDPEVQRYTVQLLLNKNDPKVNARVLALIKP